MAAKMCEKTNTDVLILKGENPSIIFRAFDGEDIGTMFIGK
jgi:glutamate 5-kinase